MQRILVRKLCRNLFTQKITWICLVIYGVTFYVVLPILCKDMKYSWYYQNPLHTSTSMSYHLNQNKLRVNAALAFFDSIRLRNLSFDFSNPGKSRENVDIDVMLITTSRRGTQTKGNEPRYLTQTLWQFMIILNSTETRKLPWNISLSICNVDADFHEEATTLSTFVRHFQRKNIPPELNILEKEKQDYAFCLEESLKAKPRYSFLVEDDVYPHPQLFEILYYILETRPLEMASHQIGSDSSDSLKEKNVLFYKLYHPERILGFWSIEPERIPELLSFASLCGTFATLFINYRVTIYHSCRTWLLAVLYFLLLAIVIGRPHLMELRCVWKRLFTVGPTPSCCTPGMLFTATEAPGWLNYMNSHSCKTGYGKDSLLDDYRRSYSAKGLIVQPNLFAHIGFFSTLRKGFIKPVVMYYPPWMKVF